MNDLYNQIELLLKKVDFEAIWNGFEPCGFAVFTAETVYLKDKQIPWDERFMGSTVIQFEGRLLAIWMIVDEDDIDAERIAAGIVHEMFHCFQSKQNDSRGINEFAMFAYPQDLDNCQLKTAENHYLAKAFIESSRVDFAQFIALRRARRRIIGDIIMQEMHGETSEGMAEFASLMALRQINRNKFMEDIEKHIIYMRSPDNLFNVRRMAYSVGCVMCFAMKSLNIDFFHELSDSRTLFELIPHEADAVETNFYTQKQKLQDEFDSFMKNHNNRVEIDEEIAGFDPMNMVRLGDKFLCKRFVMLGKQYFDGPIMLEMKKDSDRQVTAYIR